MPTIETPYDDMVAVPQDLIEDIHYHLTCYDNSKTRSNAGYHLSELGDKVSMLITWHPGHNGDNGTMPWEREDDEFNAPIAP